MGIDYKIIEQKDDIMETIVECPFCHKPTPYGKTIMISGFVGCENCYWTPRVGLRDTVMFLKEHNYPAYLEGSFYKRGYQND